MGTEDVQMENVFINVFPKPFHQQARVQVSGAEFLQINFELYDITGTLLYQQLRYDNDFDIQVADLTAGVYFYRIIADGQLLNSGKLMAR